MKLALLPLAALALSVATAATTPTPTTKAATLAPDCTQAQRQTINKLLQQDVNPAKACYAKARGDITTLSTSRLCPLEECRDWLTFVAANTPDCIYDDTNYGRDFRKKDKDCGDPATNGAANSSSGSKESNSTSSATPKPTPTLSASSSGSKESNATVVTTPKPTTKAPVASSSGSGSTSFEIEPVEATEAPEVTFPPATSAPVPTTRAPPASAASTLASTYAAAVMVAVTATALAL